MNPANPLVDTYRYRLRFNTPIMIVMPWDVQKHEDIIRDWLVLYDYSVWVVPPHHEAECGHPASFARKKRNTSTGYGATRLVVVACDMMARMRTLKNKLWYSFHVKLLGQCPACGEFVSLL